MTWKSEAYRDLRQEALPTEARLALRLGLEFSDSDEAAWPDRDDSAAIEAVPVPQVICFKVRPVFNAYI